VFSSQTCKIFKLSCYQNYCSDSNQILQRNKDHQELFVGHPRLCTTNVFVQKKIMTCGSSKLVKQLLRYSNFTAAILNQYCIIVRTPKYSYWFIPKYSTQIEDGGQTCFHTRMCLLGVAVISTPFWRLNIPKPHFGIVNRCFHAKHAIYSNFYIMKATAEIGTKFYTALRTLSETAPHKSKMAVILKK